MRQRARFSDQFEDKVGMHQGTVLSTSFFTVVVEFCY